MLLTRSQIHKLYEMINEYPNEDRLELMSNNNSGIGNTIVAAIKYASGTREDHRDITDYDIW